MPQTNNPLNKSDSVTPFSYYLSDQVGTPLSSSQNRAMIQLLMVADFAGMNNADFNILGKNLYSQRCLSNTQ